MTIVERRDNADPWRRLTTSDSEIMPLAPLRSAATGPVSTLVAAIGRRGAFCDNRCSRLAVPFLGARLREESLSGRDGPAHCRSALTRPLRSWSTHVAFPRADRLHRLRLPGPAVCHRLLWRPAQRAAGAAHARLDLQHVSGGVLHQLDLLRRGGPVHRPVVGLPAHLPGADPAADVRALGGTEDDDDLQAGEHHLDRRL